MNNLICIFFGHIDDKITFPMDDRISVEHTGIVLGSIKMCERCDKMFLETLPKNMRKEKSK